MEQVDVGGRSAAEEMPPLNMPPLNMPPLNMPPLNMPPPNMPPPNMPPNMPTSILYSNDQSEPVDYFRTKETMRPFHMLLGIWCSDCGVSRTQYAALRELLQTLTDFSPIRTLPECLSSLKKNLRGQFEIIPIRRTKIPVVSTKLPTLSAAEKRLAATTGQWMYFFDPVPLFLKVIQTPGFQKKMFKGMGQFVDRPSELWQSMSWGSSVRSSSGEFARYPDRQPVFPSDIIQYSCMYEHCHCQIGDNHLGRVICVGKNYTSFAVEGEEGAIRVVIQVLLRRGDVSAEVHALLENTGPPFSSNELIIHEGNISYLSESQVISRKDNVILDYQFQNGLSDEILDFPDKLFVRRALDLHMNSVDPLHLTSPLRAELEISHYGREKLVRTFDSDRVISVPYQLFIDGFGLYRNMYRSLMGIYMIPACFSAADRNKINNIYPITLGPHGSNFTDVISSLGGLTTLDQGVDVDWYDGQKMKVVPYCLSFLGDMPQQNACAGFKGPTAILACRKCLVNETERGNLEYDIKKMGRYHHQTLELRKLVESKRGKEREEFCTKYGLSLEQTALFKIAPCLNLTSSFPSDPAHSEFAGISKMAHSMLLENILTKQGKSLYYAQLRQFPFPSGWNRLQSPLSHLDSYNLQEHARASIILPLLLRCFMVRDWINPAYYSAICRVRNCFQTPAEDIIVGIYADIAYNNSVLAWSSMSAQDRSNLKGIITKARAGLQNLIEAAAITVEGSTRRGRSQSLLPSRQATRSPSPSPSPAVGNQVQESQKGKTLRSMIRRPNVHIGLHYIEQAREYGVPFNSHVLACEGKHK